MRWRSNVECKFPWRTQTRTINILTQINIKEGNRNIEHLTWSCSLSSSHLWCLQLYQTRCVFLFWFVWWVKFRFKFVSILAASCDVLFKHHLGVLRFHRKVQNVINVTFPFTWSPAEPAASVLLYTKLPQEIHQSQSLLVTRPEKKNCVRAQRT